jgi:hypothetical protein
MLEAGSRNGHTNRVRQLPNHLICANASTPFYIVAQKQFDKDLHYFAEINS